MSIVRQAPVEEPRDVYDCSPSEYEIWSIVHVIVVILVIAITFYTSYKFVKLYYGDKHDHDKLFYCMATFCMITVLYWVNYIAVDMTCYYKAPPIDRRITIYAAYILYYTQLYLFLLIFYLKINKLFIETQFELSQSIKIVFVIVFIVDLLLLFSSFFLGAEDRIKGQIFGTISTFGMLILMMSLIVLFVNKLSAVYREDNDEKLTNITKITILISVSSIFTICDIIMAIVANLNIHYVDGIYIFISSMDVLIRLFCVILSFEQCNGYYDKFCSCLHKECVVCCSKCMKQSDQQDFIGNKDMEVNKTEHELINIEDDTEHMYEDGYTR
eukprot:230772_1